MRKVRKPDDLLIMVTLALLRSLLLFFLGLFFVDFERFNRVRACFPPLLQRSRDSGEIASL
jgi:hypothetical protein